MINKNDLELLAATIRHHDFSPIEEVWLQDFLNRSLEMVKQFAQLQSKISTDEDSSNRTAV